MFHQVPLSRRGCASLHDRLDEIGHAFIRAGAPLSTLEEEASACKIIRNAQIKGDLAIAVKSAIQAANHFILIDTVDAERGAIAAVTVYDCLAARRAEDRDGMHAGCSAFNREDRHFPGNKIFDAQTEASGIAAVELKDVGRA